MGWIGYNAVQKNGAISDRPQGTTRGLGTALQGNLLALLIRQTRPRLFAQWPRAQHLHRAVGVVRRGFLLFLRLTGHRFGAKPQHLHGHDRSPALLGRRLLAARRVFGRLGRRRPRRAGRTHGAGVHRRCRRHARRLALGLDIRRVHHAQGRDVDVPAHSNPRLARIDRAQWRDQVDIPRRYFRDRVERGDPGTGARHRRR